jgi:hypothetical protein
VRPRDYAGVQRAADQWTVAPVWTLGQGDTGPLPHPGNGAWLLPWKRRGRLAQQVSTLAQGAGLAPVGEAAHLPQALEAVGHNMPQKTPEKLMSLPCHGVPLMALAPIAIRAAHLARAHSTEAMMSHRDAVDRAAQVLEHVDWPGARRRGVHHPRLAIELIEQGGEACGGPAPGRLLSAAHRLFVVGLWEGREALGAADRAHGRHRAEEARMGGHPAGAVLGQRASGHQTVEVDVSSERLVPGGQNHRRPALAVPVLRATWAEGRAGGAAEQGQQGPFVPREERLEGMRHGKHRVEGGRGEQRSALRLHPLGRGPRLAGGTVAIPARARRLARTAARGTPLRMPSELGCATGAEGVDDLLLGRGDPMGLPGGSAREAEEVSEFPLRPVASWLAVSGMGTAHRGRHRPPSAVALGRSAGQPSRSHGRWTVAKCCRVIGRYRVGVSRRRWPSRSCMVRRAPPASSRGVAKPWRHVWRPLPWVIPAPRLVWEEICCAVAMDMGLGRSGPIKSPGEGREHCQEARSAASRRADSSVERS